MIARIVMLALVATLSLAGSGTMAADARPEIFTDVENRALKGYDTVAYHLDRKATRGSSEFAYEWKGATWWFSSAENRDLFIADPERWAPQFGGYCAWAIVKDQVRPIDPKIFRIFNDKLYLNLNMKIHKRWLAKHNEFIQEGEARWPDVLVWKKK